MKERKPTTENYADFQSAYDFYNAKMFGGSLSDCLITMQRKGRSYGYFSGDRWASGNDLTDEIALNPQYFATTTVEDVLSTLVHEMIHLWQHHHGKPGSGRYHNKEWAAKMKEHGLYPSSTGEEGGKETGNTVSHYIIEGGQFDRLTAELIKAGFDITWHDRASQVAASGADGSGEEEGKPNPKNKIKYSCPSCGVNAWAKPEINLACGDCMTILIAQ